MANDKWDSLGALGPHIGRKSALERLARDTLILLSEHDEIVPLEMGTEIANFAMREPGANVRKVIVPRALHDENAWKRKTWVDEVRAYLACKS